MGIFKFRKKSDKNSESDTNKSDVESAKKSRGKLHIHRKKKSLISQMKISESVPATVIDAVHGDKSVVNSDKDFVRATALPFSDGPQYPVFVMDEETLEDSGLGNRENKDQFGQISVGLKTSSGASGFLPVVTTDSLDQQYITLLPMHDAFEVLNDFPTFANYDKGWLVGLLNIDDDELHLRLTNVRIPMAQWWAYVNGKLNFKVENDELKIDENVPTTSDPLKLNANETGTIKIDPTVMAATREFEDDDGKASNSIISSFANSDDSDVRSAGTATDKDSTQGFDISEVDDLGDEDESESKPESSVALSSVVEKANQSTASQVNDISTDSGTSESVAEVNQPNAHVEKVNQSTVSKVSDSSTDFGKSVVDVNQPKVVNDVKVQPQQGSPEIQQKKNPYVETVSRDDLEADNAIMTSSVRTLSDLKVSVSDREFLDAYLKPLSVTPIPLADETNDPTGRIHHENELRRKANAELESVLKERKARLRQWFETQRSSMLDALHNKVQEDGSQIKSNRKTLKELQSDLNDDEGLRLQAQDLVKDDLDTLENQFNSDLENARQQAMVEVEAQFNQKRVELNQHKNDIIQQGVASKRQEIANHITEIKHNSQEYAQTAASKVYMEVMEQGAMEFRKAQNVLETAHRNKINELEQYIKRSRADENKRVADQADIARHDTTIAVLNERIKELQDNHKAALAENEESYKRQLEAVQSQSTSAQQLAVGQVQGDLNKVAKERDDLKARLDKQVEAYDEKLDKRDELHRKELQALRDEMKHSEDKAERDNKRRRNGYLGISVVLMLLGATGGFASGEVLLHNSSNSNTVKTVGIPMYQAPASSQPSQPSSSSSSESSKNSSSRSDNSSSSDSHKENSAPSDSHKENSAPSDSSKTNSAPDSSAKNTSPSNH